MAFDFPASPVDGQEFTPSGGPTYIFASPVWLLKSGSAASALYVGDDPPTTPGSGQLWYESDTGNTFVYYDDGNTKQWVQINLPAYMTGNFVSKAGDTMTGDLTIAKATANFTLNKATALGDNQIYGQTNGKNRWGFSLGNGLAESGSNVGSDFGLNRYNDDGSYRDSPIYIQRNVDSVYLPKGQLRFAATANPSTDANTLDDYKEGTFVPSLMFNSASVGITYSTRWGHYVKVGGTCYWWAWLVLSSKGTSTGTAQIGGLPFNAASSGAYFSGSVGYISAVTGITMPALMVPSATAIANLYNGIGGVMLDTNFSATSNLGIGGSYEVA